LARHLLFSDLTGTPLFIPRAKQKGGEHMMTLTIIIAALSLAAMTVGYVAMVKV
jgi:hypothetical protein